MGPLKESDAVYRVELTRLVPPQCPTGGGTTYVRPEEGSDERQ